MLVDLGGTYVNPMLVTHIEPYSVSRVSEGEGLNRQETVLCVAVYLLGDRKVIIEGTDDVGAVAKVLSDSMQWFRSGGEVVN